MGTPLLDQPKFKPLKRKLLREGWWPLLLILVFWKGKFGIPKALDVLFRAGKKDISSYEPVYSRHDLWVIQSGIWSIVALSILAFVIYIWTKELRKEIRQESGSIESSKSEIE